MKNFSLLLRSGAFSLFIASNALASPIECNFTDWAGADTDDIVISWLGLGFIGDPEKASVQVRVDSGYYPIQKVKIISQSKFTGFVFHTNETASDGSTYQNSYNFRIYNSGKCEGRLEHAGYTPMTARGFLR